MRWLCRRSVLALASLCQLILSSALPYDPDTAVDTAVVFQLADGQGTYRHVPLIHPCDHVPKHTCSGHRGGQSGFLPATSLNCSLCPEGSDSSAIMYAVARLDGVGERVMQAVMYMASASFYNLKFGGFLYKESYDIEHHTHGMTAADTLHLMTEYMGSNFSALRLHVANPRFDHCRRGGLEQGHNFKLVAGETALINDDCTGLPLRKDLFLLNQPFLQRLRQSTTLLDRPTKYFSGQLRIAIHLRRGDILQTTRKWWPGPDRFVPDAMYAGLLSLLGGLFGAAEIHIFSTSSSNFPNASFNRYRLRGVHVHLDGDILDDWAHMAQADVLVVAPSGFSWVAGLLNSRCVVTFKSFPWGYLPHWIQLNDDFRQAGQLRACLRDKGLALP